MKHSRSFLIGVTGFIGIVCPRGLPAQPVDRSRSEGRLDYLGRGFFRLAVGRIPFLD